MIDITKNLESTAAQLEEHLKFNHSSLRAAVEHLMVEMKYAQNELQSKGQDILIKVLKIWFFLFCPE